MLPLRPPLLVLPLCCLTLHAQPGPGGPVLEETSTCSAGFRWAVEGEVPGAGQASIHYRREGAASWTEGAPLWKVAPGTHRRRKGGEGFPLPDGSTLFAGSVLFLSPDTPYEAKLRLTTADGRTRETVLPFRTKGLPTAPVSQVMRHVIPGDGGGDGSQAQPFRGIRAAHSVAKPGTTFLLHRGDYPGGLTLSKSGGEGALIIWKAAGDGEVIIDARGTVEEKGRNISSDNVHDVWFEGLTLRNGDKGITANGSARMVIRDCRISGVEYGIMGTLDPESKMDGWYVADNVIEGPSTWPRTKGIENARGIQITGTGHEICHNRISRFADAIDTFPSARCRGIDIHHNDISECTDDGIELDESERNVRCFRNRLTNVYQGISMQPVYGGPIYVVGNLIHNVVAEPFKLHNHPSGALIIHNTIVKKGMPFLIYTQEPVTNCLTRNNLFVGGAGGYAFESTAQMEDCDFDHDGVAGAPWESFLKWNGKRYANPAAAMKEAPAWTHIHILSTPDLFMGGTVPPTDEKQIASVPDLRLKEDSTAIDLGIPLPGFNDGFAGRAPDLGALEAGGSLPLYGPERGK